MDARQCCNPATGGKHYKSGASSWVIPRVRGAFDIDSGTQCAKISRRNSLHHWKQKNDIK
jgi:hypothetical protein